MKKLEITTEQVLADAEIAAQYLRALIDKQIPMHHAVIMTCSYMGSLISARRDYEEPKPPWEGGAS